MMAVYEELLLPINYGGLVLKNKIIFAPTSMGLSHTEMEERIRSIAAGGAAMIVVGDVPVTKRGHGSLFRKKEFAFYQHLCELSHTYDCKVCAQLHCSDSNARSMLKYIPGMLMKRISMDRLRELLNEEVGPYISGMPPAKVQGITASFKDAALKAVEAGFDMVQVHGDRMCGSFSSSLFNTRTDAYGGDAQHRARFAVEAVSAIRKALPALPIDYKLAVRQEHPHYGNAGVLLEELNVFVPLLEQAGVTSFHVTLANHGKLSDTIPPANHPSFSAEGCFLHFCDEVRAYTSLPICAVGGFHNPAFIEEQLKLGRMQCVAMSRQLIADPMWPKKVKEGRIQEIQHCIRCNVKCLGGMQRHQGVHCIFEQ